MEDAAERNEWLLTRRGVFALAGSAAAAAFLAACGSDKPSSGATTTAASSNGATTTAASTGSGANAAKFGGGGGDGTIKIGFTAPLTGGLAGFGEANDFIVGTMNDLVKDGLQIGGKSYAVDIIVRDVQTNSDTAASQAQKLISEDKVDLIIAMATPEMINPVADQCEANGVPCLSTLAPWQPYFFGRNGDPATGFDWTYHFFWGADQLVGVFTNIWNAVPNNKQVAMLNANDPDGSALADAKTGFPGGATAAGYKLVDGGRFKVGSDDFSAIIGQFKGSDVMVGIPIPPDFATFWKQAKQQGFNPKVVTIAKALLFPSAVEALGDDADGICTEVWWTPSHPFKSSLTGTSAKDLGDAYTKATGKQWTQFVGFVHALFEVCLDSVSRAGSTDKQKLVDAIAATKIDTIVGPISFGQANLPKNVCPTPLVGGQWQKTTGGAYKYDLVVIENKLATNIPVGGTLKPLA